MRMYPNPNPNTNPNKRSVYMASEIRGHYELYKRSCKAFVKWLSREASQKLNTCSEILAAASAVTAEMPPHVSLDLTTAIRLRKEV